MAKSRHHNTKTNKAQHTQAAALHPDGTGRWVSFRTSSGCTDPTDADAGRTDDSVDPARRNNRTPRGRSSRRRRQRPRHRSLTLRLALQLLLDDSVDTTPLQADGPGSGSSRGPIDTHSCCCLRRRPRCQPTYPDSRLVRRANAALCVLLATVPAGTAVLSNQRRQHSRCEAPLRLTQSRRLRAITLSAHCRALTPLNFTPLNFSTPLPHTAEYACVL